MGEIAARLSDLAVVTSDNPRSEDPLAIIDQVEVGVRRTGKRRFAAQELNGNLDEKWPGPGYLVEPDRMTAIAMAIKVSEPGDAVLIAGKGHETYQILADETIHFDDREAARKVLAAGRTGA
jgi:UDP-N-acetylmuramyl tripeptide synthase